MFMWLFGAWHSIDLELTEFMQHAATYWVYSVTELDLSYHTMDVW